MNITLVMVSRFMATAVVLSSFTAKAEDHTPRIGRLTIGEPVHVYPLARKPTKLMKPREHLRLQFLSGKITSTSTVVRLPLTEREAFWGLGERFDAWNLRGRSIACWVRDMAQGGHTSSYVAVPFVISSEGYGLFVNCAGPVHFDLGESNPNELLITVPEPGAMLYFFRGAPAQIVEAYTQLAGRPQNVPDWILQPWLSRNSYLSAYEIERVLDRMDAHGLKAGVIVLEAWAEQLQNFRFEKRRYPRPRRFIERLRDRGYRIVLWETPSLSPNSTTYREARREGFLVRDEKGDELVLDWPENFRKVDFRNHKARSWWQRLHGRLIDLGVDGFKTDGGERMPDPFFHNLHPYAYQRSVIKAFRARKKHGVVFARSASAPCAAQTLLWAGDQHAVWSSLPELLRAGLSAGLSGFACWGHDIGGYMGTPEKKLYIRWLQLGTFTPIMQFHGVTRREPWVYDEETLHIAKFYFGIRQKLIPYLKHTLSQTYETGAPIWRPMLWDHPDDPIAQATADQFMLGDDLLVAPMLHESDERSIYLPAGSWLDLWTGEKHVGPTTLQQRAELAVIPLFARSDAASRFAELLAGRAPFTPTETEPVRYETPATWRVAGPFPGGVGCKPHGDMRTVSAERPLSIKRPWLPVPAEARRDDGRVDDGKALDSAAFTTVYALTTLESDGARTIRCLAGSGDGMTVWLNGRKVFSKDVHRSAERDEDAFEMNLKPGTNTVVLKLSRDIGPREFYFRILR